uniref:PTS mannose/fructose/sorbose transporter subunit IIB n=1 Tax=candidate division WOR-3 bacterium TaxID=2052148 RepID=A0A7C4XAC4_UNCW3
MLILRVDDRLIHGQVIAGWVRPLGIEVLILASDKISKDEWSINIYQLAVPEGIEFHCFDISTGAKYLLAQADTKRLMTVVESILDAYNLIKNGVKIKEVNIGGLSYTEGARTIAPYIYLTPEEIEAAVKIHEMGVKLIGKQLPNSPKIDVIKKLTGVI